MLHTKFRGNRSIGSGEDFLRVFTIYGRAGHLGHVIPTHRGSTQKLALIGQAVSEMVEHCGRTDGRKTDDRWTSDHGYTISSPGEPAAEVR